MTRNKKKNARTSSFSRECLNDYVPVQLSFIDNDGVIRKEYVVKKSPYFVCSCCKQRRTAKNLAYSLYPLFVCRKCFKRVGVV